MKPGDRFLLKDGVRARERLGRIGILIGVRPTDPNFGEVYVVEKIINNRIYFFVNKKIWFVHDDMVKETCLFHDNYIG